MKVAVIGAGVVGITTAYELAVDGHEVTVLDRRSAAAEEASFANAGIVSLGSAYPWPASTLATKLWRQALGRHSPLRLRLPLSRLELTWFWQWLQSCSAETWLARRQHLQQLASYSRERLDVLTERLSLSFDCSQGYLVLLRTAKDVKNAQPGLQLLRDSGVTALELDAAGVYALEPAMNPDTPLEGGIQLPDDGVANCRQFALLLKREAELLGASFEFNTSVSHLNIAGPASLLAVHEVSASRSFNATAQGDESVRHFDRIVVCAGADAATLLKPFQLDLPVVSVHGYSISAAIGEPLNAPRSAVMDARHQITVSRLGQRVRVAGGFELGGGFDAKSAETTDALYRILQDWFPGAARMSSNNSMGGGSIQVWKGARPSLPDGIPILGDSKVPGVWLNLGHGNQGWMLSCGSARAIADLMAHKPAEINLHGLGVQARR